jgi:flagellin
MAISYHSGEDSLKIMSVANNVAAMQVHGRLRHTGAQEATAMERLSGGYRINRASDGAAELAISEKMRGQIRGLRMAQRNVEDGIALIRTAEGGLAMDNDILQRMRELALASCHDVYGDLDRTVLAEEYDALMEEIDHIAENAEYNNIKLLDGDRERGGRAASHSVAMGTTMYAAKTVRAAAPRAGDGAAIGDPIELPPVVSTGIWPPGDYMMEFSDMTFKRGTWDVAYFDFTATSSGYDAPNFIFAFSVFMEDRSKGFDLQFTAPNGELFAVSTPSPDEPDFDDFEYIEGFGVVQYSYGDGELMMAIHPGQTDIHGTPSLDRNYEYNGRWTVSIFSAEEEATDYTYGFTGRLDTEEGHFSAGFYDYARDTDSPEPPDPPPIDPPPVDPPPVDPPIIPPPDPPVYSSAPGYTTRGEKSFVFQVGPNSGQTAALRIPGMDSESIGIADTGIDTLHSAKTTLENLDAALEFVVGVRGELGAMTNRLEFTLSALGVTEENLADAESRIRDADMAKEMMELTKSQMLRQVGVAMLSQANQEPETVLQLLR